MKKIIVQNKKAFHDYFIEDRFEAGIQLKGTEIKSIRKGSVAIKESYVSFDNGEAIINDMYIAHYEQGNRFNHDERRPRKLLLHKHQIAKLSGLVKIKGYTIVPISLYLDKGLAKVEIALAKGKANYDKREVLKEKEAEREIKKNLKNHLIR